VSEHLADGEWVENEDSGCWKVAAVEHAEVAHYYKTTAGIVAERRLVWRRCCREEIGSRSRDDWSQGAVEELGCCNKHRLADSIALGAAARAVESLDTSQRVHADYSHGEAAALDMESVVADDYLRMPRHCGGCSDAGIGVEVESHIHSPFHAEEVIEHIRRR
jgi:hypothetical protein